MNTGLTHLRFSDQREAAVRELVRAAKAGISDLVRANYKYEGLDELINALASLRSAWPGIGE